MPSARTLFKHISLDQKAKVVSLRAETKLYGAYQIKNFFNAASKFQKFTALAKMEFYFMIKLFVTNLIALSLIWILNTIARANFHWPHLPLPHTDIVYLCLCWSLYPLAAILQFSRFEFSQAMKSILLPNTSNVQWPSWCG